MNQRSITEADVRHVVAYPDISVSRADGRTEYLGAVQQRRLKVVVDEQANPPRVVTTYWLEDWKAGPACSST